MSFELYSSAFKNGGEIPVRYTCEGEDISPPLEWSNVPPQTRSLVLIVEDPDAPDPKHPKMTWVHWVLYDIPPDARGLGEGVALDTLSGTIRQGINDWQRPGYGGPCPPVGRHRYFFNLYALDIRLGNFGSLTKKEVEEAMAGHVLAKAVLLGTYKKSR